MERDNCAFDKVEIRRTTSGHIKFDGFMDAEFCGLTVVAAMGFVAHTDAPIFDLRQTWRRAAGDGDDDCELSVR